MKTPAPPPLPGSGVTPLQAEPLELAPARRWAWVWKLGLVVVGVMLLAALIMMQIRRGREAMDREQWQVVSARYGPLTSADRHANYEYRGFMDPSSYHELRLTPATFQALRGRALVEPPANMSHAPRAWRNAVASGPAWFAIPANAQIVHAEGRTYAFVQATHTVYIYRWGL